MELNEYQNQAMKTCTNTSNNFSYMALNLVGEVGECMGKIAKHIRKDKANINNNKIEFNITDAERSEIKKELGDIFWQLNGLCSVLGFKAEDICQQNLDKLQDRQNRGVIVGDGDNR